MNKMDMVDRIAAIIVVTVAMCLIIGVYLAVTIVTAKPYIALAAPAFVLYVFAVYNVTRRQ